MNPSLNVFLDVDFDVVESSSIAFNTIGECCCGFDTVVDNGWNAWFGDKKIDDTCNRMNGNALFDAIMMDDGMDIVSPFRYVCIE